MTEFFELGFSQTKNEIQLDSIPVKGVIPPWLTGTLIRNGPGTFNVGNRSYRHWFDGLAMLHKFSFKTGEVSYSNKFLECKAYNEAMEKGKISYSEFATDPCRSLFGKLTAVFNQKITDSAKVNVGQIGEQFLALGETPMQIEFDPITLESLGVYKYEEKFKQHITTVHPQFDFKSGEVYNLVTRFNRISHYRIKRVLDGRSEVAAEIPVKEPAYIHSFGMSEKYLILTEYPLVVNPLKLLFQIKPFIENFIWKPKNGARFLIFEKKTGKLAAEVKTDAFFAFHHINAFDDGEDLVIDINAYPDADIIRAFYLNRLKDKKSRLPFGEFRRYHLNPANGSIRYEKISDECIELARYDYERLNMNKDYRYVYAVSVNKKAPEGFYNQLVKIDIHNKKSKNWFTEHCYPGEPVFVGRPGRTDEDDGVVLSVVLNEKKGNSFLLILDAATFTEIARAEIPHPVLFGYHGEFFDQI